MQLWTLKHLHNTPEMVRGQPQAISSTTYAELLDNTVLHTITSVCFIKGDSMLR